MIDWVLSGLLGGSLRMLEAFFASAPTLLVGMLVAGIMRFYLGVVGIQRLFGGDSLRSLPQSWAVGMLLPVCSIGVLPILIEMRRAKVKAGAMSAFALSAPLFNPLSLLYGVTLSRPNVILLFAFASLMVVTAVGLIWDLYSSRRSSNSADDQDASKSSVIGVRRLLAVVVHGCRQFVGPVGAFTFVAVLGVGLLAAALPWGALGHAMERDDLAAPARMAAVAIPAYATPMLAMSQLGMMFQHANSPGAAFVLLALGAGVNLGTLAWMARNEGLRSVLIWFGCLMLVVVSLAYAVNKPLVPPGVTPSGHTHAFDIYTNPIYNLDANAWAFASQKLADKFGLIEQVSAVIFAVIAVLGILFRCLGWSEGSLATNEAMQTTTQAVGEDLRFDRIVSPEVVGGTMIAGLIAISVVMCYAFYPSPDECQKEIAFIRTEVMSGARSGDTGHAKFWIPRWDEWTRRMEVGAFLRRGQVTAYQRMQGFLVRRKLDTLEHELDHDHVDRSFITGLLEDLTNTDARWGCSYRDPFEGDTNPADPFSVVIRTSAETPSSNRNVHAEVGAHLHQPAHAPHGGTIVASRRDLQGAENRNLHLEVMPREDGELVIYPLRLMLGVFRTFKEKPGDLFIHIHSEAMKQTVASPPGVAMQWDLEMQRYRLALPPDFSDDDWIGCEFIWSDGSSSQLELFR
ncbi:MAG: permease [Planctomycetota bacterium]